MKAVSPPNPISLFLVIGALAGNAQIAGFDIFLILAAPVAVMLLTAPGQRLSSNFNALALIAILPFFVLLYRALEVDPHYFELYWLWPIKAVILALLLSSQRGNAWPIANDVALAGFTVLLLFTAQIEEGRLVSFFGPNMLYRFFGVTFLMSTFRLYSARSGVRAFLIGTMAVSAFGMILTGSVGALLVFAIGIFVARQSLAYLLRSAFGLIVLAAVAAGLWISPSFLSESLGGRITHKIENLDRDERIHTWTTLLERDTGWLGIEHAEFSWLWTHRVPYPHNSLIELYAFYGIFGAAVALAMLTAFAWFRNTRYYFFIPLVVILVGSMISGDLSDNFAIFAFPLLVALQFRFFSAERAAPRDTGIPVGKHLHTMLKPAA